MQTNSRIQRIFRPLLFATALAAFFACHLTQSTKTNRSFDFTTLGATIQGADFAIIVLKDTTGNAIDTLFNGPVGPFTKFQGLDAPHYDGGVAIISIEARSGDRTIYKVERTYDGRTQEESNRIVSVSPSSSIKVEWLVPRIRVGDNIPLPSVKISPTNLASLEALWSSRHPQFLGVTTTHLKGLAPGIATLVVALKSDTSKRDSIAVEVLPRVVTGIDSIRFEEDFLEVVVNGASDTLLARVYPAEAIAPLYFMVRDASVAQIEKSKVFGVKEGQTWILVRAVEDSTKTDSIRVTVLAAQSVDSVKVKPDTLRLYTGGENRSLSATLYPTSLEGRFFWRSGNLEVAQVDARGMVSPIAEGKTFISSQAKADASKMDSALAIIRKDTPRLMVGNDTVVSAGTSVTHYLSATQEYGLIVMFRWDLNGDGVFEDSATTLRNQLSSTYEEAKDYRVRFYARDSEGNDTTIIRKVKAVNGRVVQIVTPKDSSFFNTTPITVTWNVDGQTLTNSQALVSGKNLITRSALDSAGKSYSHSVTVYLDQTAPNAPLVRGPVFPVNTLKPQWVWSTGGGSGIGTFRYRLGNPDLTSSPSTQDTFYTPAGNLGEGVYILFVSERDEAGNWSQNGSFAVRIDTSAPPAPLVTVSPTGKTNETRPTWSWSGGIGDANRYFRFKMDSEDFRSGSRDTVGLGFRPGTSLSEGPHTLYVQVRDSAGNWSLSGSASVQIDVTGPNKPIFDFSAIMQPVNSVKPKWAWSSGGNGGSGSYRVKLNDGNLSSGATMVDGTTFISPVDLGEGTQVLYIEERDSAGNWSGTSSGNLLIALRGLVGGKAVSDQAVRYTQILLGSTETPYIAFHGNYSAGLNKVMHFNGANWVETGSNSPFDPDVNQSIEVMEFRMDPATGRPHIAWYANDHIESRSFNGTTWTDLGSPDGNQGASPAREFSMAVNRKGRPVIAYLDEGNLHVKAHNIRWENEFPSVLPDLSFSMRHFGLDTLSNTPYVCLVDLSGAVKVLTYSNSKWSTLDNTGLPAVRPEYSTFGVSPKGELYVALADEQNGDKAVVFKHNGSQWVRFGSASFITEAPVSPFGLALGFAISAEPILTASSAGKVIVYFYTGAKWRTMPAEGISGSMSRLSIAVTRSNIPYIAGGTTGSEGSPRVYKTSFDP